MKRRTESKVRAAKKIFGKASRPGNLMQRKEAKKVEMPSGGAAVARWRGGGWPTADGCRLTEDGARHGGWSLILGVCLTSPSCLGVCFVQRHETRRDIGFGDAGSDGHRGQDLRRDPDRNCLGTGAEGYGQQKGGASHDGGRAQTWVLG